MIKAFARQVRVELHVFQKLTIIQQTRFVRANQAQRVPTKRIVERL